MSKIPTVARACAAALATLFLAGCRLTSGGGSEAELRAMPSAPAEVVLARGQTGRATVSFSLRFDNSQGNNNSVTCGSPIGVPGGLEATLSGCPMNSFGGNFDGVVSWNLDLRALTVEPGSYDIQLPARACLDAFDDASVGDDFDRCSEASASLRVVITGGPDVPGTWRGLGDALNVAAAPSTTHGVALAVDAQSRPVAAWVENGSLVVRRWDGGAWQTLDAGLTTRTAIGRPALVVMTDDNQPVVAWTEARTTPSTSNEPTQVQLRRWNGSAWTVMPGLPAPAADVQSARAPALLAESDGLLHFAWAEEPATEGGWRVRVLYHYTEWVEPYGIFNGVASPARLQLAPLASRNSALAWLDQGAGRVVVQRLDYGQPAVELGRFPVVNASEFALTASLTHGLLLAIPPSPPAVQFQVLRWDGNLWPVFGGTHGPLAPPGFVHDVALGIEAVSGSPLLAWSQSTPTQRLFVVRRWNGSGWLNLGDALPAMGRTAPGQNFRVAVAGGTRPLVAMETGAGAPDADFAIRVSEFR